MITIAGGGRMSDGDRIAYIIGWLHGFEPMVWTLVGEKLPIETADEYSKLVYELVSLLVTTQEKEDA